MTKYQVLVEHELNGEVGTDEHEIEAASVKVSAEWIVFFKAALEKSSGIVAAFPTDRVISVVPVKD